MCSVVPLDSATVPEPDHDPSKPANGPLDWAWPAETDNNSAAPTPAAATAWPNRPEPNSFMVSFPIQNRRPRWSSVSPHRRFSVVPVCQVQMADSYGLLAPPGAAFFRFNQTAIALGAGESHSPPCSFRPPCPAIAICDEG